MKIKFLAKKILLLEEKAIKKKNQAKAALIIGILFYTCPLHKQERNLLEICPLCNGSGI